MPTFIDQLGNSIHLSGPPKRIISIVPSQSELLWDLGLENELTGITKFCIHPKKMFSTVTRVGGTKKLDLAKIRMLVPDLIIGNKEENERSQIEELQKEFNVWMSDINNFDDALAMMRKVGDITGKEKEAERIITKIKDALPGVRNIFSNKKVAYFIWKDPYMLSAGNTYIDHVLSYAGLVNVAEHLNRYPAVTIAELKDMAPEYCLLSSEPFPFKEKHAKEIESLIGCKAIIVDGELFSWYGSRLLHLPGYLKKLTREIV